MHMLNHCQLLCIEESHQSFFMFVYLFWVDFLLS
jgi:hypothetical protein